MRGVWQRHNLLTKHERLLRLEKAIAERSITLTDGELAAFRAKLDPVVDRWIAEVKGKDIDGAALVAKARKLTDKYSK